MDVSIIIPNYNGENLLKENLPKIVESILQYIKGNTELIVADDNSSDKSVAFLEDYKNKLQKSKISLKIVKNIQNKGFSSNVESGVKLATGEILVLLNTDVIPYKDFLLPLLKNFSDKDLFAAGCLDESQENGKVVLRGRGSGIWNRGFLVHSAADTTGGKDTLWASGGSSAFRKSIWEKIGGLNTLYNPFYWEDIDLSFRAQKMGYKVIFEPKSRVVHKHSTGSIMSQITPAKIKKTAYRNQFFFIWLNITDKNLLISHIFWLPYHMLNAIKNADIAFIFGLFQALLKLPKVLLFRQRNKNLFTKTDAEILKKWKNL